jgi:glycosyltransferase involved in cell wall biosynthesis
MECRTESNPYASRMKTTKNGTFVRRLRVAHVALGLNMGGMEKLLVEFARYANRERFELHFVSLGTRGGLAADIEACGWPVAALNEPPGLRTSLLFRLARLFRRWDVDVVHTHNTKPLLYGGPAARLARVAGLIHTRHGQRYQSSGRVTALFRLAARLANRIVCVSQDAARLSAREGGTRKKLCTIWNGIDVSRFAYAGPKADGPVVMVGRLSPEKDVETLIRAAAFAVRKEPSFRLELAGDGDCLPALRRLTCELGLVGHVRFLGEVRDIPGLLGRASLFALPSLTEGISLTLLEAMARGLPVVATRVGGNPEVVVDGETGFLVPARAPSELADAMLRLQRGLEEGRRMGLAGRHRVEQHFDVRRMVSGYEELYLELSRGGSNPHKRRDERPKDDESAGYKVN